MNMKQYTRLNRLNACVLAFDCYFGTDTQVRFEIMDNTDPDGFGGYTALVDYDSLPAFADITEYWIATRLDADILEEIRQDTIYGDFYADTLEDMANLLGKAYQQYLIGLGLI